MNQREQAVDINDLSFWFPKIEAAGLPVPRTTIIHTDAELLNLLDGVLPDGFNDLVTDIREAAEEMGLKSFFLRTGHTSGKHNWNSTCFVQKGDDEETIGFHVGRLVEHSSMAGIMGLPTQTWVVRELIPTRPLFYCLSYGYFPVTREFRVFARDGKVEGIFPYWPEAAIEQGMPDSPNWKHTLQSVSSLDADEHDALCEIAESASETLTGYWSVDLLQDSDGKWWLTDMADGDRSWRPGMDE